MKSFSPVRYLAAPLSLFLLVAPVFAQTSNLLIPARVENTLADPVFKNASVGIIARSLDDGRLIYERGADLALMPASNEKIITAWATLTALGVDFRYETTILRTGAVDKDGILKGDLYLRGSGDPSLDSARLLEMAKAVRASGIKKIEGRIIADASRFDDERLGEGWPWDNDPYYYQAQISALCCDENVVIVQAAPGDAPGKPVRITVGGKFAETLAFARSTYLGVSSTATTAEASVKSESIQFDRARGRNLALVRGQIPLKSEPVSGVLTVEDPALFAATRLTELLQVKAGVIVTGLPLSGITPTGAVVVTETQSARLSDLTKHFLKTSDNLYGECYLKTIGAEKGKAGSASEGIRWIDNALKEAGIDRSGLRIADGSGLSRINSVTPRLLSTLLAYVDQKVAPDLKAVFEDALPLGGVDGTIRSRFRNTPGEKNVRAKTGSLSRVSSLSGFVTTKAGERVVFSIVMNQFAGGQGATSARMAQDAIVLALIDTPRPVAAATAPR